MDVQTFHSYRCPTCGEENEVLVDLSAGFKQQMVEDCSVCCRPHVLSIVVEWRSEAVSVVADPER